MPDSAAPSGNFLHKPLRGWLHPDHVILKKGVTYAVRYVGCLDVNISMKSLDFDTRFQIAKECINRVCEVAGLKTVDRKRKIDKRVARSIGDNPNMKHAGSDVKLLISSVCLTLKLLDTDAIVATHDMPRISFASGGDSETLDFVAYVAKDTNNWRACFVLECGGGLAQDVITTIGQAFDLRFKQFLTRPLIEQMPRDEREREYYNDMPGKVPPDVGPPPVPPLPSSHCNTTLEPRGMLFYTGIMEWVEHTGLPATCFLERLLSTNLIDLNCEVTAPSPSVDLHIHEYVNDMVASSVRSTQPRDVFDMQPFVSDDTTTIGTINNTTVNEMRLQDEIWFHGSIGRQQAESLLHSDGDFLVRESQGSPGQYVLTGIQSGVKKHLLLIDPEGVVRTKHRMFGSVSHLINYHCQNKLPIISAESALILLNPVRRTSLIH